MKKLSLKEEAKLTPNIKYSSDKNKRNIFKFDINKIIHKCHYCNKLIFINLKWGEYRRTATNKPTKIKYPFHKRHLKVALKEQALWFENLDANCSDCKHFCNPKWGVSEMGFKCRIGVCEKNKKQVITFPQTYSGNNCFEHR